MMGEETPVLEVHIKPELSHTGVIRAYLVVSRYMRPELQLSIMLHIEYRDQQG